MDSLIRLCDRLGLPCYATSEQLEITRDKWKFKNCCRENGVPTVKEYTSVADVDEYPVIVKPTDRAGSIGISIAQNRDELEKACRYARECSVTKQIIIEKYIDKGTKIDLYYAVENGKISLMTTCDTIPAKNNGYERVVQSAWLYPSRNNGSALRDIDQALRKMIQSLGIRYGCIFFSGFVCDNGEIVIFESGFRLEGGHQYNYVARRGPYNYLDLFILHALTGKTDMLPSAPIDKDLLAVTINLYAKKGTITRIQGLEEIETLPDCCLAMAQGRVGEVCDESHAILKKLAIFQFASRSQDQLKRDVDLLYRVFGVYDENGEDMIYDRIETNSIIGWWTGRSRECIDQGKR
ncbi:MAG: ATP-grasp domain-containing protein [Clostridia bacterium]|nr:ATP-grasp domain-containing protein [Clostridia bacterium]